ncbi:MAG: hypothetical protein A2162_12820 [Deltaproteobacteria bacterium RBG_13_52_11b]|nr:MAG: hypothetical protein A2162_12820 [Deltaproteobacteria bacterium RBG_13_52_11b]
MNLSTFQHEDGSRIEVHPEHRFFNVLSEIGFRPSERVRRWDEETFLSPSFSGAPVRQHARVGQAMQGVQGTELRS